MNQKQRMARRAGLLRAHAVIAGRRLEFYRQALGFESAAAFARALGLPAWRVQRAERGEGMQQFRSFMPIVSRARARGYGLSYNWLWEDTLFPTVPSPETIKEHQQEARRQRLRVIDGGA